MIGTLIEDKEKCVLYCAIIFPPPLSPVSVDSSQTEWEATLAKIVWVFQFHERTEVKLLFLVDNFKALISLQPFNYFLINTISKVFKQMKSPSDLI